jgi:hypothetical protein
MGGTVTLTSAGISRGSRMTVRVPLRKAPVNGVPATPSPNPSPATEQKSFATPTQAVNPAKRQKPEDVKILLAEDNALIREIVMKTLSRMKVRIFSPSSPTSLVLTSVHSFSSPPSQCKTDRNASSKSRETSTM